MLTPSSPFHVHDTSSLIISDHTRHHSTHDIRIDLDHHTYAIQHLSLTNANCCVASRYSCCNSVHVA